MIKYFLIFSLGLGVHLYASDAFYYSNGKKVSLSPVETASLNKKSSARVSSTVKYYKTSSNSVVGVSNQIIVKFKNLESFEEIVDTYKLVLLKEIYKNSYLFEVDAHSDALDIANQIYKLKSVSFAHPNFIKKVTYR